MVLPIIPADKLPVILTILGRCIVARYIQTANYEYEIERAANWEALEDDARQAVEDQIGAVFGTDVYTCPDELAARAEWSSDG